MVAALALVIAAFALPAPLPALSEFAPRVDNKLYVRGVGTVLEETVKGGDEVNELVAIRR